MRVVVPSPSFWPQARSQTYPKLVTQLLNYCYYVVVWTSVLILSRSLFALPFSFFLLLLSALTSVRTRICLLFFQLELHLDRLPLSFECGV